MEKIEHYHGNLLSIEQMKELEQLGFDVSDSSCMWTSIQDKDYNPIDWLPVFRGKDCQSLEVLQNHFPLTYKEGNVYYCYTLDDLLRKIPYRYKLSNNWIEVYPNTHKGDCISCDGDNNIEAVFNAVKTLNQLGLIH